MKKHKLKKLLAEEEAKRKADEANSIAEAEEISRAVRQKRFQAKMKSTWLSGMMDDLGAIKKQHKDIYKIIYGEKPPKD